MNILLALQIIQSYRDLIKVYYSNYLVRHIEACCTFDAFHKCSTALSSQKAVRGFLLPPGAVEYRYRLRERRLVYSVSVHDERQTRCTAVVSATDGTWTWRLVAGKYDLDVCRVTDTIKPSSFVFCGHMCGT